MADRGAILKVVLVGEGGKTSLMHRCCVREFPKRCHPTIGVDFMTKHVTVGAADVVVQFWDGAEDGRLSFVRAFYSGSSAAIVVCDLSSPESVRSVAAYCAEYRRESRPDRFTPPGLLVIIGNKADAAQDGADAEAAAVAAGLGVPYFSVSAKTGDGVDAAFEQAIALGLAHRDNQQWAAVLSAQADGFTEPGGVRLPLAPLPLLRSKLR